jgi:hypothetical protein
LILADICNAVVCVLLRSLPQLATATGRTQLTIAPIKNDNTDLSVKALSEITTALGRFHEGGAAFRPRHTKRSARIDNTTITDGVKNLHIRNEFRVNS